MCAQANVLAPKGVNRTSQIVTSIIPANTTIQVFQAGDKFYLVVSTAVLTIKPDKGSGAEYVQGTGCEVDDLNIFASLQISNNTPNAVVFQMFVGFGTYIDNRLIVYDPSVLQVVFPTAPINNVLNEILIPDRSATPIIAANGKKVLALNRVAIYISNLDSGVAYSISDLSPSTDIFLTVQPQSNIVYPANGNFRIKIPSGNINAIVSEIYNAILPT